MSRLTYEELEAENARLKSALDARPGSRPQAARDRRGWPWFGRGALIALGCLALVALDLGLWANRTVISHQGYMAAVSPLVHDPAIQTALVKSTQDQINSNVDVTQTVKDALPERAAFLAGPIATGVNNSIHAFLTKAVQSDRFATAWDNVNNRAHQRLVNYVSKYQGDGRVTVADAVSALSSRLQSTPLATVASKPLPPKYGNIELINASWLPVVHDIYLATQWIVPVGILVALLGFGLAVWLSPRRRKTILAAALATAFTLGLANIAVRLVEQVRQGRITDETYRRAAHAVSQALLGPFITQTRVWIALALIIAAVAWVPGATRLRAWLRRRSATLMHATGNLGAGTPAITWLRSHRRAIEWALVGLAVAILMFLTPLTMPVVVWTAVALAILVILLEIITSTTSAQTSRATP